jgi:hypothetical protein
MNELTKEDWHLILGDHFKIDNGKSDGFEQIYDTLKILSVVKIDMNKIRVNYMATQGTHSKSFGVYDVNKKDVPGLLREVKIKKILSK